MALTGEQLLQAKLPQEVLQIPGLGEVYVRGMTGKELNQWQQEMLHRRKESKADLDPHYSASIAIRVACDENGKRLFTDKQLESVSNLPAFVTEPISDCGARLSGMGAAAREEIAKNSLTGPSAGST